jgi:hypothetical protein
MVNTGMEQTAQITPTRLVVYHYFTSVGKTIRSIIRQLCLAGLA